MALFPKKGYGFYASCLLDGGKSNGVVLQDLHGILFMLLHLIGQV